MATTKYVLAFVIFLAGCGSENSTTTAETKTCFENNNETIYVDSGFNLNSGINQLTPTELGLTDILSEREGFGHDITGGMDGLVYSVTSLEDSGPGTLRDAAESPDPLWIVFNISGTFTLEKPIRVSSNKTIDGRSAEVNITGWGIYVASPFSLPIDGLYVDPGAENVTQNVIINNIAICGVKGSNIRIATAHKVWVHHVTLTGDGRLNKSNSDNVTDGLFDVTRLHKNVVGGSRVLLSWSQLKDESKGSLLGHQNIQPDQQWTDDKNLKVTMHHNYFNDVNERSPRVSKAAVHSYNNVFQNWVYHAGCSGSGGFLYTQDSFFIPKAGSGEGIVGRCGGSHGYTYTLRPRKYGEVSIASNKGYYESDTFKPELEPNYQFTSESTTDELLEIIKLHSGRIL